MTGWRFIISHTSIHTQNMFVEQREKMQWACTAVNRVSRNNNLGCLSQPSSVAADHGQYRSFWVSYDSSMIKLQRDKKTSDRQTTDHSIFLCPEIKLITGGCQNSKKLWTNGKQPGSVCPYILAITLSASGDQRSYTEGYVKKKLEWISVKCNWGFLVREFDQMNSKLERPNCLLLQRFECGLQQAFMRYNAITLLDQFYTEASESFSKTWQATLSTVIEQGSKWSSQSLISDTFSKRQAGISVEQDAVINGHKRT